LTTTSSSYKQGSQRISTALLVRKHYRSKTLFAAFFKCSQKLRYKIRCALRGNNLTKATEATRNAPQNNPRIKNMISTSLASTEADHNTPIKKDVGENPSNLEETISAAVETPVSSEHLTLASKYFKDYLPQTSQDMMKSIC
jgi:hypothetical protein